MNIFILHPTSIRKTARYHCDQHVVKMVTEYTQMLCAAVRLHGSPNRLTYRLTHANHPCTIWVRKSIANYNWLYELTEELNREYLRRWPRKEAHKAWLVAQKQKPPSLPRKAQTEFVQAMPDAYKQDVAWRAYRRFYIRDKLDFARWKYTPPPPWIPEKRINKLIRLGRVDPSLC